MARNDHLRTVMQHPAIQDGITDDEAKIVATLHSVMKYNPDLLNKLLNKKRVHLEERIIELPLAGKTWLTIIRTKTGWQQSMDYLENAVRSIEQFMSSPFPTNHVVLLFENAHDPRAGGGYFGTHAVLDADLYDSAGRSADWRASIIAHEIAHYYWHGHDESWIIEGSAEMLRIITEQHRTGRPIETYQTNCVDLYISDLERMAIERGTDEYRWKYCLGEQFFIDMYSRLGPSPFRSGMKYYLAHSKKGIRGLVDSFKNTSPPNQAFLVDLVVAKRYGSLVPVGPGFLHASHADPLLPSINGRIENLRLNLRQNDNVYQISSDDPRNSIRLTVEFTRQANGLFELAPGYCPHCRRRERANRSGTDHR